LGAFIRLAKNNLVNIYGALCVLLCLAWLAFIFLVGADKVSQKFGGKFFLPPDSHAFGMVVAPTLILVSVLSIL
jgi:hypothetical protein